MEQKIQPNDYFDFECVHDNDNNTPFTFCAAVGSFVRSFVRLIVCLFVIAVTVLVAY